jgi:hypothetical protein
MLLAFFASWLVLFVRCGIFCSHKGRSIPASRVERRGAMAESAEHVPFLYLRVVDLVFKVWRDGAFHVGGVLTMLLLADPEDDRVVLLHQGYLSPRASHTG